MLKYRNGKCQQSIGLLQRKRHNFILCILFLDKEENLSVEKRMQYGGGRAVHQEEKWKHQKSSTIPIQVHNRSPLKAPMPENHIFCLIFIFQ